MTAMPETATRETATPADGFPAAAIEAADRAASAAQDADEAAALMDRVLSGERSASASVLAMVRDVLGGLHVQMSELADELQANF